MRMNNVMMISFYLVIFMLVYSCVKIFSKQSLQGKIAPTFTGQATFPDGAHGTINLQDYIGENLVIYFYPMDNSPYCTLQAQDFSKKFHKLTYQKITVIGISSDSVQSHSKFQCSLQLPYPLISDTTPKYSIAKKYGAKGLLFGQRKTFLINKDGIIFKIFDHINIEHQIEDILQAFKV